MSDIEDYYQLHGSKVDPLIGIISQWLEAVYYVPEIERCR
jgi:hypothetical protein